MRTTILIDDELGARLRDEATARGQSLSAFLAEAGRAALKAPIGSTARPFRLITYSGDGPQAGIDLDRTNELLVAEDEDTYRQ